MGIDENSQEWLVLRGSVILSRYRHPEDWEDGNSTGKPHLRGTKTLRVEEIRIGNPPPGLPANDEAHARREARAILAFARELRVRIQVDQQPGKAPRIYVANDEWQHVLPVLQSLRV